MRFVVAKVALGQVLQSISVSLVGIILPLLHTHPRLHVAVTIGTDRRSLGTVKTMLIRKYTKGC